MKHLVPLLVLVSAGSGSVALGEVVVGSTTQLRAATTTVATPVAAFRPHRIAYQALLESDDATAWKIEQEEALFAAALERDGIVSITNIPQWRELQEKTLSWEFHQCLVLETDGSSGTAQSHTYADGTIRRTMATHTTTDGGSGGRQPFTFDTSKKSNCAPLLPAMEAFRSVVHTVTLAFANRLSSHLEHVRTDPSTPWLATTNEQRPNYFTVQQIVKGGDHLEHFHSYQRVIETEASEEEDSAGEKAARKTPPEEPSDRHRSTIGVHTDQGLFLVFAPGRWVHRDPSQPTALSEGLDMELRDGTVVPVLLEEPDELVVMLGDGVHQYINDHLPCDKALRAVPHALSLAPHNVNAARLWHGRMILPPPQAIHPQHGQTFGALREALIRVSTSRSSRESSDAAAEDIMDLDRQREILSLGCSHPLQVARQLEDTACAADSLYCWHECQLLTEYNVSDTVCAQQGRQLSCVDPAGDLWDGTTHGDYFPGCAKDNAPPTTNNSTTPSTTTTSPVSAPSPPAVPTAPVTTPAPAPTSAATTPSSWGSAGILRFVAWMGIVVVAAAEVSAR